MELVDILMARCSVSLCLLIFELHFINEFQMARKKKKEGKRIYNRKKQRKLLVQFSDLNFIMLSSDAM